MFLFPIMNIGLLNDKFPPNYCLHHCFSNFNVHTSHLWLVLKCGFWFHMSGVGISSKLVILKLLVCLKLDTLSREGQHLSLYWYLNVTVKLSADKGVATSDLIFQIPSNQFRSGFAAKWVMNNLFLIVERTRIVCEQLLAKFQRTIFPQCTLVTFSKNAVYMKNNKQYYELLRKTELVLGSDTQQSFLLNMSVQ